MFIKSQGITIKRKNSPSISLPDIEINQGESTLLLGPSGSGKTTLISLLAGLLKPTTGQILIDGEDFYKMPSSVRDSIRGKQFGLIFQTLHLLPSLTLSQNIELAADMSETQPEAGRLEYLLETLGLIGKAHRKPDTLSQGELQRAAIARAVLLKPKIIIADEPTSALDDDNAQSVIELLDKHAKDTGAALLISTHDNRIKNKFKTIINL